MAEGKVAEETKPGILGLARLLGGEAAGGYLATHRPLAGHLVAQKRTGK